MDGTNAAQGFVYGASRESVNPTATDKPEVSLPGGVSLIGEVTPYLSFPFDGSLRAWEAKSSWDRKVEVADLSPTQERKLRLKKVAHNRIEKRRRQGIANQILQLKQKKS